MNRSKLLVLVFLIMTVALITISFAPVSSAFVSDQEDVADTKHLLVANKTALISENMGSATWVWFGDNGRLQYYQDANGNRVPDFSYAGYMGGGVRLPYLPVRVTVSPGKGDDTALIQAAINQVASLTPDAQGFRGAVLLTAGTYEVGGTLNINTSGIVLRGEGQWAGGTLLRATGATPRSLINIAGVGNRSEISGTRQNITDSYVAVGARSFNVANASGFSVGDDIIVVRNPNQEWIDALGMDSCTTVGTSYDTADVNGSTCLDNPWTPSSRIMHYERKVVAVSGNQITIDAPIVDAINTQLFGGGYVYKYQFSGRIEQCGVENLRADSDYVSATDENHAETMIRLTNVQNAWVQDVTSVHFVQGTVLLGGGVKWATVQDSSSLDHISQITGGRRYPFNMDDCQLSLVQRCYTTEARHDYVTGSVVPGPNVFLNSKAERSHSDVGPHHRWTTGTLYDTITHRTVGTGPMLGVHNRGNSGTGHGWSGAQQVFWNCVANRHRVESPPYALNWSIGCRANSSQGNGEFNSYGTQVYPKSLYLMQLKERLGVGAVRNITRIQGPFATF